MFEVTISENIGNALNTVDRSLRPALAKSNEIAKNKLAAAIIKEYQLGRGRWKDIRDWYRLWKIRHGLSPEIMKATHRLEADTLALPRTIKARIIGDTCYISFADSWQNSPYVFYHETGYRSSLWGTDGFPVPPRDFIVKGMERAKMDIYAASGGVIRMMREVVDFPEKYGVPRRTQLMAKDGRYVLPEWVFWVLPMGKYFLILGAVSDCISLMKGTFWKPEATTKWLGAYMQGRVLLTRKVARRRFRQTLYAGGR